MLGLPAMTLDTDGKQFRNGRRHGVSEERARTIQFLRAAAEDNQGDASVLNAAADAIERGDHARLVALNRKKKNKKPIAKMKPTSLGEVASRIQEYLRRFEAEHSITINGKIMICREPRVRRAGNHIVILYTSDGNEWSLSHAVGRAYLSWLDAGHVGYHYHLPNRNARQTPPEEQGRIARPA
jgi:hypothetical protein